MTYPFPSDIADRIQALLATGDFADEKEVLSEAMDVLERRQRGLTQLRAMIAEAEADVAAGRVGPFDVEATIREVRERLAADSIFD